MIFGVGTDIMDIERMEKAAENSRFLERVFTGAEIDYCKSRPNPWQSFAVRFAAKEAVYKIFSVHLTALVWRDIEVVLLPDGQPQLNLFGEVADAAKKLGVIKLYISLSHSDKLAQAFVVAEC